MGLLFRVLGAGFSGLMLFSTFQPTGLWWAGPLGFALFFTVVTARRAVLLTAVQAFTMYALLLPWIGEFVGASAWIALAVVQTLYLLLFGWGLKKLWLWGAPGNAWPSSSAKSGHFAKANTSARQKASMTRGVFLSLAAALWFVAVDLLRSSWPFGGFPWGRIAWGQVGGPLAMLITVGGPAVVTFAVVFIGGLLAVLIRHLRLGFYRQSVPLSASVVVILLGAVAFTAITNNQRQQASKEGETRNVAAIQGNVPRLGLDFAAQRSAVLNNHVHRTEELGENIKNGKAPQPDIVVWPENASDVNPFSDESAAEAISGAVDAVGAPILVGTVTPEHNRMVVWTPEGAGEFHDKKFLQPFGEYMPFRDLLRKVNSYVDQAGNFQPGHGTGVVHMNNVAVGVATCYEVSFDGAFRDSVRHGAQIMTSPTNNATFGFTDMTYQQLAMNRMRALEYDRPVVIAATSGVSAIVQPDGTVTKQSRIFTPDILQADIPLRDTMTLSARIGPVLEWVLSALGCAAVILAMYAGRAARPAATPRATTKKKSSRQHS